MTTPGDGTVGMPASGELTALAGRLQHSSDALQKSLGLEADSPMWNSPDLYTDYFGPARDIAKQYVDLTRRYKKLVTDSVTALHTGSETFIAAARLFAEAEAENERRMREGPP